jgi:hypothetical protein
MTKVSCCDFYPFLEECREWFLSLWLVGLHVAFGVGLHGEVRAQGVGESELIKAPPDMPMYSLAAMSVTDRFGKPSVVINYERKTQGTGLVRLSGRTADGPLKLTGLGIITNNKGTIELGSLFPSDGGLNAELFLEASGSFAEEVPYRCLVSNTVNVGSYSGSTVAREWNAREKQAYEQDLKGRQPPSTTPAGHKIVRASDKLAPGMPAKVGYYGDWADAEILTEAPRVTVKLESNGSLRLIPRDGWIAAMPEVIQKASAGSHAYKPSILVLPNTTTPVPDGYVPITSEMPVVAGVPIKALWQLKYADATIMSVDGTQILVHIDSMDFAFDQKMDRSTVLIAKEVIPKLSEPDAKATFASRVPKMTTLEERQAEMRAKIDADIERAQRDAERMQKKIEDDIARQNAALEKKMEKGFADPGRLPLLLQPAPVTLRVPKEAEPVPAKLKLLKGTKLAACWGPQWSPLTVLEDTEDDDVPIHWDQLGNDAKINRSQLIIRKTDLKAVKQEVAKATTRTWRDATGKFSVDATFVSKTSTNLTLRKQDGKEVTLQIAKLSKEDVQWIKENL